MYSHILRDAFTLSFIYLTIDIISTFANFIKC